MPGQVLSAQLKVKAGGAALEAWLERALVGWEVQDNRSTPDSFLLQFADPSYKVLGTAALGIGKPVDLSVKVDGGGSAKTLLAGEITAVELDYSEQQTVAIVRGLDASHRLYRGRRTESYEGQQVSDIISKVAQRAGLSAADTGSIPKGGKRDVINQVAESDAAFLDRLTRQIGAQWWVVDRKLYVKALPKPQGAPAESTPADSNDLVLDPVHGLISLLASASAAGQVKEVQVPGWDPVKKEKVLGRANVEHPSLQVNGFTPAGVAGKFSGETPPLVYGGVVATSQEEADAAATSVANQVASGVVELDGTMIGNPDLRAGVAVTVGASVKPFAGRYVLTSTRHYQHRGGSYRTDFIASGWTDRSLSGVIADAATAQVPSSNLMIGVVRNIDDPDKYGRVRVNLPHIGENHKTGWLPVVYPGAGKGAGLVAPLAVDAQVLVAVPTGNPDAAVVIGGIHNQKDTLPELPDGVTFHDDSTGDVQGMCLTAPGGAQIAVVKSQDSQLISLISEDGKHSIKIDQTNQKITITTSGKIELSGDQGISLKSDSGDITIESSSGGVTVKSNSGSVTVESSSGSTSVKGTSVTVDAGSGSTSVKGSAVQIG